MHKSHKNVLSNMRQVLLLFFQHHIFGKKCSKHSLDLFKRSINLWTLDIFPVFTCKNQNCTESQSIQLFPLYVGVFSCCCETYPIDFMQFSKALLCESYSITNCTELFVFNGNERLTRYEFHNGVKPNGYNGNMVYITFKSVAL